MGINHLNFNQVALQIKNGEQIHEDSMNLAINEITDTRFSKKQRIDALEISKSIGNYLDSEALIDFICEKYSEKDLNILIESRKKIVSRFVILLPTIIEIINLTEIHDISYAIHQIYDCVRDYAVIEKSQFASQQRKKAEQGIRSIIRLAEQLSEALDEALLHVDVDVEFRRHKDAVARFYEKKPQVSDVTDLRSELMALRFSSSLTLYRDSVGNKLLYVGDNKAKTHIVECAYALALNFGAPTLKTTPGSDFSDLCSLIFELASGIQYESLAGAINRFARSPKRLEMDEEERIRRFQNSEQGIVEYESDNFYTIKKRIKSLDAEESFWKNMFSSKIWDKYATLQISIRMLDVIQQKQTAIKQHGPFLVWASQMHPSTLDELIQESDRYEEKILSLALELGQKTRHRVD